MKAYTYKTRKGVKVTVRPKRPGTVPLNQLLKPFLKPGVFTK